MNPAATDPTAPAPLRPLERAKAAVPVSLETLLSLAALMFHKGGVQWFALLSSLGLFAFTLAQPSLLRWGVATTYCCLIFVFPNLRHKEE